MKLIMFDIDGTIINSMATDSQCFIKSTKEAFDINDFNTNWHEYIHATDINILSEIFLVKKNRNISKEEINRFIKVFKENLIKHLEDNNESFCEIGGAKKFIDYLSYKGYGISIATGGFREIAQLKLESIGINIDAIPFACSHNGTSRELIMKTSEKMALEAYKVEKFDEIIYFGDEIWDYNACKNLSYTFIAITENIEKFKNLKPFLILKDYLGIEIF